jgi:hypothetical protein
VHEGRDVGAEAGAASVLHRLDDDRLQRGKNEQAGALAERDQAYSGGDEARGKRLQVGLAILSKEPVFAVDHEFSERWRVRPFIKLTRAMPLDPARPLATRTLILAVKNGDTLVIFPEGRITVTGRLMKLYDGAALIAEKSGAMVVPMRIEGLEATIFSPLTRTQVRRRWFPKVTVTVLEPVRLSVDGALKGKARRQAAGAMLYRIMSSLIFRTTLTDRTIVEAVTETAPALALDTPMFNRFGTVGRLLPGIEARLAPVPRGGGGRSALRARPQCHARLSEGRQPRRAGAARGRLARHRRHRRD